MGAWVCVVCVSSVCGGKDDGRGVRVKVECEGEVGGLEGVCVCVCVCVKGAWVYGYYGWC